MEIDRQLTRCYVCGRPGVNIRSEFGVRLCARCISSVMDSQLKNLKEQPAYNKDHDQTYAFGVEYARGNMDITFPLLEVSNDKMLSFVCGYFDEVGEFKYDYRYPEISLCSDSKEFLEIVADVWGVQYNGNNKICVSGNKAIDICGKMYENVSFKHSEKYKHYIDILNWHPSVSGSWNGRLLFKYKKLSSDAIPPIKNRVTDSGYDLHAVELTYNEDLDLYKANTKIAVEPAPGWYFDLVGRSSLPKTGFMFAGGVGIIDKSYTGPIIMFLKKFRPAAELPKLPFKLGQIIPRRIVHADFVEAENLGESDRESDGFGSTGL